VNPIITSLLDNDLYTFTVGQVAFMHFPGLKVKYQFINRGKTQVPAGFADQLNQQLELMRNIFMTDEEYAWLDNLNYFSYDYLTFLRNYKFDPSQLTIVQDGGNLSVEFNGDWDSLIMWEVPFLALFSELYYKVMGSEKDPHWKNRITAKALSLSLNGSKWMEFGTRRRFSFEVQNKVVSIQKEFEGFIGTSNMLLAMKHNVPCKGTMSHQGPMAMQGVFGVVLANRKWREYWRRTYGDKLNTFLPDTFTTAVFFRDFTAEEAKQWNLRQDSGDPYEWTKLVLSNYERLGEPTLSHTFTYSDSLNAFKFNAITNAYNTHFKVAGGIGTDFSNDCGHKAVSIVIKLSGVYYDGKFVDVVKLSDDPVKHTGKPEAIAKAKQELGII
jgi:nicotinate phosphoribosyltransferase